MCVNLRFEHHFDTANSPSMNISTKIGFLFLTFFQLLQPIQAFQTPVNNTLLPNDLEVKRKYTEQLALQGDWETALEGYAAIQTACANRQLDAARVGVYDDIFSIIVLRDDWEVVDKINLIRQTKDPHPFFEGIQYGGLAHLYVFYGDLDSMQHYYDRAIAIYQAQEAYELAGSLSINIAYELYMLEESLVAESFLKEAEQILKTHLAPIKMDLPLLYNVQSLVYYELGNYRKALKSSLKSIQLLEKDSLVYAFDLMYEYNNLASIYSTSGDYNNALNYYQKALEILEQEEDYPLEEAISSYYNMGSAYIALGNAEQGKKWFLKSIEQLDVSGTTSKQAKTFYIDNCIQLTQAYRLLESPDSAFHFLKLAEQFQQEVPYQTTATKLHYGFLYLYSGNYDKALTYAKQLLVADQLTDSDFAYYTYWIMSDVAVERKQHEKALYYLQLGLESISINFSDPNGVSNPNLENVLHLSRLFVLLKKKLQLLQTIYQQENNQLKPKDIFASAQLATKSLLYMNRELKDIASKRHWLNKEAIPLFEQAIAATLELANQTGDKTYLNKALMLSEQSKSILMADAMQEATAIGFIPDSLLQKSEELKQNLSNAQKSRFDAHMSGDAATEKVANEAIFSYKHQLDLLKYKFEKEYPKYFALKYENKVSSVADIQATLKTGTLLLEYFVGDQQIYVFAISKDAVQTDIIPKDEGFEKKLTKFQQSLININGFLRRPTKGYNNFIEQSADFYDLLLKKYLKETHDRLIIVPDGILSYLPFEVLLTERLPLLKQNHNTIIDFAELPYIIKDYKVSYNYSGTLLLNQRLQKNANSNGNIFALAPSYKNSPTPDWRGQRELAMRKSLIDLPGAANEVKHLESLYNGKFVTAQIANETAFKQIAAQYGILHLAMHGLVDKTNPEFSGLAFAEDASRKEDNFLYAYEIKQLELNANLVVLSACETGIGKYQRGEGVVSIGRSFMYAGAPSLLMTLWNLNDQSGAVIIEQFYQNLQAGMEKDEAIRQAKLYYMKNYPGEYAHPFMWAAFVQLGDYSNIEVAPKNNLLYYLLGALAVAVLGGGWFFRRSRNSERA